jgi:hypothetical protein
MLRDTFVIALAERRVFYKNVKLKSQFKSPHNCTQLLSPILRYWPENDHLMRKHFAKLKI